MDIHIQRERKKQDELERVHERNFENPKLMRQILIFLVNFIYASHF